MTIKQNRQHIAICSICRKEKNLMFIKDKICQYCYIHTVKQNTHVNSKNPWKNSLNMGKRLTRAQKNLANSFDGFEAIHINTEI